VESLHLTSGADPATQMLVSWFTEGPVRCAAPGATRHGGRWFGRSVDADARTYA